MPWCVPPWVQLLWTLRASWTSWKSISFARLGKFSSIICSNKFSIFCSSSSPSGTPIIRMLEHFEMPWRFLSLSSFFEFLFLHSFLVGCSFFPSGPHCLLESQLFMTLNVSCQSLLACKTSLEKSADNLMGIPL